MSSVVFIHKIMQNKISDPFILNMIDNTKLQIIISLSDDEKLLYINNLIKKYYSNIEFNTDVYFNLQKAYIGSFVLEDRFRQNEEIQKAFRPIYTKTGLIRNIVNDLFFIPEELTVH